MAKYVGKIFRVSNTKLGLRGNSTHYVYVQWYDMKNKDFKCRVISSLEREKKFSKNDPERAILGKSIFHRSSEDSFCIFKKQNYEMLRDGDIEPIPMRKLENATHWFGFTKSLRLNKEDLKYENKEMKYKK